MNNISDHEIWNWEVKYFETIDNIFIEMNRRLKKTKFIEAMEACNPSCKIFIFGKNI